MDDVTIRDVPDAAIEPFYGYTTWLESGTTVEVAASLSGRARAFVVAHEMQHVIDGPGRTWFMRELRANLAAAKQESIGALIVVARTLCSRKRLAAYWGRFWRG